MIGSMLALAISGKSPLETDVIYPLQLCRGWRRNEHCARENPETHSQVIIHKNRVLKPNNF